MLNKISVDNFESEQETITTDDQHSPSTIFSLSLLVVVNVRTPHTDTRHAQTHAHKYMHAHKHA